jgi:L-threonylcarbamoyladenylate synthase
MPSTVRASILPPTPENIATAAEAIRRGEVVGMPTETVYGLAGAALMPDALARIFDTKERPTFDPLIVHVGFGAKSVSALEHLGLVDGKRLGEAARARAEALIQKFWPGPLTLVLPKGEKVPELATSGLATVALRMPAHRVAQWLIAAAGMPLAAPSANRFGRISPTTAQAVSDELGDRIDWILDGGACDVGVESTVIRVGDDGALTQLRPGGLSRAEIEQAAGVAVEVASSTSRPAAPESQAQASPGMLESHYAPVKPLYLLPGPIVSLTDADWQRIAARIKSTSGDVPALGILAAACADPAPMAELARAHLEAADLAGAAVTILALSRSGDAREAARSLFARLRELDASPAQLLFAEPWPADRGLGHAIADRLGRASRGQIP